MFSANSAENLCSQSAFGNKAYCPTLGSKTKGVGFTKLYCFSFLFLKRYMAKGGRTSALCESQLSKASAYQPPTV